MGDCLLPLAFIPNSSNYKDSNAGNGAGVFDVQHWGIVLFFRNLFPALAFGASLLAPEAPLHEKLIARLRRILGTRQSSVKKFLVFFFSASQAVQVAARVAGMKNWMMISSPIGCSACAADNFDSPSSLERNRTVGR
jgi:hypothetical protein